MTDDQTAPKNIHEALLRLQADPPLLTKQKQGQVGSQITKYADLPAVNAQVLSRLNELGVTWTCLPTLQEADQSGPGRFVLAYELRHVASQTFLAGDYPLGAGEPQKMGSAITYARRYALLAVTGVAAEDEDDDGSGNGTTAARKPRQTRAKAEPSTRAAPASAPEANRPAPAVKTDAMRRKMFAGLRDIGLGGKDDREATLGLIANMIGREVSSTNDLTPAEQSGMIDALEKVKGRPDAMTAAVEVYHRTTGRPRQPAARTADQRHTDSIVGVPDGAGSDETPPWEVEDGALLAQDGTTGGPS